MKPLANLALAASRLCLGVTALMLYAAPASAEQIVFWTMQLSPFHDAYIKSVIRQFEAANPDVRVKWVDVPWSEMEKKTLAAVASASTRAPPDVVNLNPQFASKLAEFRALANPEQYLSPAEISEFLPAAWRANRLDGVTFAIPWYLTSNVTLYNKALFARAGALVPRTHDELLVAAQKIRARTGGYAYFPALDGSIPLENLVSMGGQIVSADGCHAGFNNASGTTILNYYRTLYRDQLVPKNVVTEGHRKAVEMFMAGEIAMVTTGTPFLANIKNANPTLYQNLGVAAQIGAFQAAPPNIAAMNLAVLQSSAHQKNAFRFAQFITRAEHQTAFAKRVAILPSSVKSYEDAFFLTPSDDKTLDAARMLAIQQVREGAVLVPPMRKYAKFRTSYARALQSVMLDKKTVARALADLDTDFTQLLGCKG